MTLCHQDLLIDFKAYTLVPARVFQFTGWSVKTYESYASAETYGRFSLLNCLIWQDLIIYRRLNGASLTNFVMMLLMSVLILPVGDLLILQNKSF